MKLFIIAVAAAASFAIVAGQTDPNWQLLPGVTSPDYLQFAIQFECLEAEFFSWAATGTVVPEDLRGGGPTSIGGKKAKLSAEIQSVAQEIGNDDRGHLLALRTFYTAFLGVAAPPCPQVDIGPAFAKFMDAATGSTLSPPFDPYTRDIFFLLGALILEDLAAQLYIGSVPDLATLSPGTILAGAAAELGANEAQHAAWVRAKLYKLAFRDQGTPYGYGKVADLVKAIADYRNSIDTDEFPVEFGLFGSDNNPTTNLFNTYFAGAEGLFIPRRIPGIVRILQVNNMDIGGFFPNGVNGFFGPDATTSK